jgi:hypothetical protein
MNGQGVVQQNAVTLVRRLRNAGDSQALADLLRSRGDQLISHPPGNLRAAFDAVQQLHFLSLFVIPAGGGEPPSLCLEANFDGPAHEFLADLVGALAPFLHDAFSFCEDSLGRDDARLLAYLGKSDVGYELFYVGCPGRSTAQIAQESGLAQRVEADVRALNRPAGRRFEIVRRVWNGLSRLDRELVLHIPERPFWVRHRLLERPLSTLYGFIEPPLSIVGIIVFALVAGEGIRMLLWPNAFIPLWESIAPPEPVLEVARWSGVALLCAAALASAIWWALLFAEFPAALTRRTWWYIVGAKLGEFLCASWRALPGTAALLGLIAFVYWHWWILLWSAVVVLGAVYIAALVCGVRWAIRLLRIGIREPKDHVDDMTWDANHLAPALDREDGGTGPNQPPTGDREPRMQSHLVSVVPIRPGLLAMCTLRAVLFRIHWLARIFYNPRGLFNTQSIHFARWKILRGRRLLFVSNYDGGFGGYLGIFATLGAAGVSAIWGNVVGFPRTFLLFNDGARDEQRFKRYARASQVETPLWYRRYPDLTVTAIERNGAIREDLNRFSREGRGIHEADFDAFLRHFSSTRP